MGLGISEVQLSLNLRRAAHTRQSGCFQKYSGSAFQESFWCSELEIRELVLTRVLVSVLAFELRQIT